MSGSQSQNTFPASSESDAGRISPNQPSLSAPQKALPQPPRRRLTRPGDAWSELIQRLRQRGGELAEAVLRDAGVEYKTEGRHFVANASLVGRPEETPSLKIDQKTGLWRDYGKKGSGKGRTSGDSFHLLSHRLTGLTIKNQDLSKFIFRVL